MTCCTTQQWHPQARINHVVWISGESLFFSKSPKKSHKPPKTHLHKKAKKRQKLFSLRFGPTPKNRLFGRPTRGFPRHFVGRAFELPVSAKFRHRKRDFQSGFWKFRFHVTTVKLDLVTYAISACVLFWNERDRSALKWFYVQSTSWSVGMHRGQVARFTIPTSRHGRLDISLVLQDRKVEGAGARVRRFAVYDAHLIFFSEIWSLFNTEPHFWRPLYEFCIYLFINFLNYKEKARPRKTISKSPHPIAESFWG